METNIAKTEKIEELNLIALRKYACPKISSQKDWYLKCVECRGLSGCPAGKRAIELMEQETNPDRKTQIQKFIERQEKAMDYNQNVKTDTRSQKYLDALKTNNPVKYLMDHGNFDVEWRARAALKEWLERRNGPDIREIDTSIPNNSKEMKEIISLRAKVGAKKRSDMVVDHISEMLDRSRDGLHFIGMLMMENPNLKTYSVMGKTYNWLQKYAGRFSERNAKILGEAANLLSKSKEYGKGSIDVYYDFLCKQSGTESVKDAVREEGDEVSIEDFLKENSANIEEEPKSEDPGTDVKQETPTNRMTEVVKKAASVIREHKEEIIKGLSGCSSVAAASGSGDSGSVQQTMRHEFGTKRIELKNQLANVQKDIAKLQQEEKMIMQLIQKLDDVAGMFGMKPAS